MSKTETDSPASESPPRSRGAGRSVRRPRQNWETSRSGKKEGIHTCAWDVWASGIAVAPGTAVPGTAAATAGSASAAQEREPSHRRHRRSGEGSGVRGQGCKGVSGVFPPNV